MNISIPVEGRTCSPPTPAQSKHTFSVLDADQKITRTNTKTHPKKHRKTQKMLPKWMPKMGLEMGSKKKRSHIDF